MTKTRIEANDTNLTTFIDAVPVGAENALTQKQLAAKLGWPYAVGAQALLRNGAGQVLRRFSMLALQAGVLVVGDKRGMFRPRTRQEARQGQARLASQVKSMQERLRLVRSLTRGLEA